jgi:hypothetical protein
MRFGGIASDAKTFDAIMLISSRIGWYFGSDRLGSEGEFIRVVVDRAEW